MSARALSRAGYQTCFNAGPHHLRSLCVACVPAPSTRSILFSGLGFWFWQNPSGGLSFGGAPSPSTRLLPAIGLNLKGPLSCCDTRPERAKNFGKKSQRDGRHALETLYTTKGLNLGVWGVPAGTRAAPERLPVNKP